MNQHTSSVTTSQSPLLNVNRIPDEEIALCSSQFYFKRMYPDNVCNDPCDVFTRCFSFPEDFKLSDKIALKLIQLCMLSTTLTAVLLTIVIIEGRDDESSSMSGTDDDMSPLDWIALFSMITSFSLIIFAVIFFMWLPSFCCSSGHHSGMTLPPIAQ